MLGLVITIIVVGVLLWLVETHIPMDPTIKMILRAVVIVALVLYVLYAFGILPGGLSMPVPKVR